MLDAINIAHQSEKTFYSHQKQYLQPTIVNKWLRDQEDLLNMASQMGGGLVLAGDGRRDSPGHSAKYGGFNTIECQINKVIDIQVVQSNEVGNSARCENAGLQRTYQFLKERGLQIKTIIMDRHKANEKTIREDFKVQHYFDVWHVAKSVTKKLTHLANKRKMEKVAMWKKSIINHLHWVAASTPDGDGDKMVAKWLSILNHIANIHHGHDELILRLNHQIKMPEPVHLFPACAHAPLQADDRRKLWFSPGTEEYEAVCKIVEDKYLLKDVKKLSPLYQTDVKKLSPLYQTSALESFHSLIVHFCPKHTSFSWLGMYCRLFLAAMHFNENSNREVKNDSEGNPKVAVNFPKAKKGDYSIKIMKHNCSRDYLKILMHELFVNFTTDPTALAASLPDKFQEEPAALSAGYKHPSAEEARAMYMTRFQKS